MKILTKTLTVCIAGVLTLLISGCGQEQPSVVANAQASSDELVILTWSDYFDLEIVEKFQQETGIKVRFEYYDDLSQMKDWVRSKPGQYDLLVVDEFSLSEFIDRRFVKPIDKEQVPNLANIEERFLDGAFDPGNQYSVPYLWGSVLVAYRADKIEDPEESWSLLWDEKLKGKVALLEEKEDVFAVGLLSNGYPLNSEDPALIEKATASLVKHAETMSPKYLNLDEVITQLSSGEILAAACYSGDAMVLADEDENIGVFIPEEGAALWLDNFAIAEESPNPDNAHTFINFISRGDIAAQNSEYLWTATPNKAALELLSEEFREDSTVFPKKEVWDRCDFYGTPTPERVSLTHKGMKDIMDVIRLHITDK